MKNVLKIVAIISMLLLTVFAGGCGQSQDKKYLEARNEFVAMQQQFDKDMKNFEKVYIYENKAITAPHEYHVNYVKLVGNLKNESEKKLQNMANLAKSDLKLTKDLEQVKENHYKKYNQYFNLLPQMEKEAKKAKK